MELYTPTNILFFHVTAEIHPTMGLQYLLVIKGDEIGAGYTPSKGE